MEHDLVCSLCLNDFDELTHVPLMLPMCGHSYCRSCLAKKLVEGDFICPEDQTPYQGLEIFSCPVNQTIMKIVKRGKTSPTKQLGGCEKSGQHYMCQEHNLKIEIVCLEDNQELCSKCALYGPHKLHNFKPIESVVEEVNQRMNQLLEVFGEVQANLDKLNENNMQQQVQDKFGQCLAYLYQEVDDKFQELFEYLNSKKRKVKDEILQNCHNFERYFLRKQKNTLKDLVEKAELWKLNAQEMFLNFSKKTEVGQIAIEILGSQFFITQNGRQILNLFDETTVSFDKRLKELPLNMVTFNVDNESILEALEKGCVIQASQESDEKKNQEDDSNMLLKDEDNEFIFDTPLHKLKSQLQISVKRDLHTVSTQGFSTPSRSPLRHEDDRSITSSKSPTRLQSSKLRKASKLVKLPEKIETCMNLIRAEQLEFVDLSSMELGDEGINMILPTIKSSVKLRVLKLMKNKIGDNGAIKVFEAIQNTQIQAVHMQANLITERFVEYLYVMSRQFQFPQPKNIYLNQNLISQAIKCKRKIDDLKKFGLIVSF